MRSLLRVGAAILLLFVGWGIRDLGGFFASPARAIFLGALVADMVSAIVVMKTPRFRKGTRTPGGQRFLFAFLQILTIFLIVFLPYGDRRGIHVVNAEWVRWLGLVLFVAGAVVTILALHTLGRNYSIYVTIQEQHQLVQTGIYGIVRNPIYLGNLLAWPGMCLVFRSWLVVPAFAFFLLFAVLRGAQEERVLAAHFGVDFEAYRRRTWRLVPYVY
jgi:protein-S-isoprenylcysteine O-methyltransferase Ste14